MSLTHPSSFDLGEVKDIVEIIAVAVRATIDVIYTAYIVAIAESQEPESAGETRKRADGLAPTLPGCRRLRYVFQVAPLAAGSTPPQYTAQQRQHMPSIMQILMPTSSVNFPHVFLTLQPLCFLYLWQL